MITRMEITFRSKEPTDSDFKIFSPGSCRVIKNGTEFMFDFVYYEGGSRFEDGYLYISVLQKDYDEDVGLPQKEADPLMCSLVKEDFIEINYECFADKSETQHIELIPVDITFYDYSSTGDGEPIEVKGDGFTNLEK